MKINKATANKVARIGQYVPLKGITDQLAGMQCELIPTDIVNKLGPENGIVHKIVSGTAFNKRYDEISQYRVKVIDLDTLDSYADVYVGTFEDGDPRINLWINHSYINMLTLKDED